MPKVFLSHSHDDARLAELLTDLLIFSLKLDEEDIRCTGVQGYGLAPGLTIDERLRIEVLESEVLIGLISPSSLESIYVLFELGARWGTGKPLIPLLAPGIEPEDLKPPLSGLSGLRCDDGHDLRRLVQDLAAQIKVSTRSLAAYERHINRILEFAGRGLVPRTATTVTITRPKDDEEVVRRPLVEGTVDNPHAEVWLVVHPAGHRKYWVQPRATVEDDGWWSATPYVGAAGPADEGATFELRAVANPKRSLRENLELAEWPAAEAQSDVLKVTRRARESRP